MTSTTPPPPPPPPSPPPSPPRLPSPTGGSPRKRVRDAAEEDAEGTAGKRRRLETNDNEDEAIVFDNTAYSADRAADRAQVTADACTSINDQASTRGKRRRTQEDDLASEEPPAKKQREDGVEALSPKVESPAKETSPDSFEELSHHAQVPESSFGTQDAAGELGEDSTLTTIATASDDTAELQQGDCTPPSSPASSPEEDLPPVEEADKLRGLGNTGNACFSNSVIQLLATAFSSKTIAKLRGTDDLPLHEPKDYRRCHSMAASDSLDTKFHKKPYRTLETEIKELQSPSVSAVLGQLLIDLRAGISMKGCSKDWICPVLFQALFAIHTTEKPDAWNGRHQADASEYLGHVLQQLIKEGTLSENDITSILQDTTSCTNPECAYESSKANSHSLLTTGLIPADNTELASLINDAISHKSTINTEIKCSTCEKGSRVEEFKCLSLPPILMVDISRQDSSSHRKLAIPWEDKIELAGMKYSVEAVISHIGNDGAGHYTTSRRFQDSYWLLNDTIVQKLKGAPKDGVRSGKDTNNAKIVLLMRSDEVAAPTT